MRNFFAKSAILTIFNMTKNRTQIGAEHQRKWVLSCQILLSILGVFVASFYLMKIYEVPVYTTEFQILHEGVMDSSNIHLSLVRDYDTYKSDEGKYRRKLINSGGIKIEGLFYDVSRITHSNILSKDDSMIYSKLDEMLDTAKFDYKNNLGDLAYLTIRGKSRQFWGVKYGNDVKSEELCDTILEKPTEYYHYGIMNVEERVDTRYCKRGRWQMPIKNLFTYTKQRVFQEEYNSERFYVNSKNVLHF